MTDLIITEPQPLAEFTELDEAVRENLTAAKARNTRRAYAADWEHFTTWCEGAGLPALPADPSTVARYLTAVSADYKVATLTRRLSGISVAHGYAGYESPTHARLVKDTLRGIRRRRAGEQQTQKEAADTDIIRAMVAHLGETTGDIHDRALLLIGFAAALRRSELVAIDVNDIRFTKDGIVLTVRKSKTDQEGEGREVGIPYGSRTETCPVRSTREWLEHASITEGAVFRHINRHGQVKARLNAGSVARIVKQAAAAAGLDPTLFAGHSLRAGLATAAAAAGVNERSIMDQTGHKSLTVARRYIRRGSLFRDNAAAQVGL